MIFNKIKNLFNSQGDNNNSSNSDNNSNDNNISTFPNIIFKLIIQILSNHINSIYKSLESQDVNKSQEKEANKLLISIALVSKLFFQQLSNNIESVINFNYDYLFRKTTSQLFSKKKLYTINNTPEIINYYKYYYPNNYVPATSKYSIIRLENIKTIKLDLFSSRVYGSSDFHDNFTLKDGSSQILKFTGQFVFEKIKELINLKRIIIRISSGEKISIENFPLNKFISNLKCKNIQVSDYVHREGENIQDITLFKKTGSIIIGDRQNSKLLYETIQHFYNNNNNNGGDKKRGRGFERLYIYSSASNIGHLLDFTGQKSIDSIKTYSLNDGINYFKNLTTIQINRPFSFKDIIVLLDSTPNLKELDLLVCFNILILSLSSDKNLEELGLNKWLFISYCEGCMFSVEKRKNQEDFQNNFQDCIESFKKKSKLSTLKLTQKCRFAAINGLDGLNNLNDESKLLSFHQQFSKLILAIPNLSSLQIFGFNNPFLFKYLLQVENNKSITDYSLDFSGPFLIDHTQTIELMVNNIDNNHIQSFLYYCKGSNNILYKYDKSKKIK